jgi:RND family efflux transporter MFP subunit
MNKPIRKLPEPSSKKEKFFITGKNIYTTYYNTKNLEIILQKYTLRAPFDGILTDALVNPGTLIRPGQKLGEFIDPSIYELEVSISKTMLADLSVGKKVVISKPDTDGENWEGKIVRINGKINPSMQTINIFIDVRSKDLREGMYLQALIEGKYKPNAYEVPRNMLIDESKLFIVENNTLRSVPITILHKTTSTIIVSGLKDNSFIVIKPIPGAYAGMTITKQLID